MNNIFENDPISKITAIHHKMIRPNLYNPNRMLTREMNLLERSILKYGIIQPILVCKKEDGVFIVIDGFHRLSIFSKSKKILEKYKGYVPCCILELSETDRISLTITMNTAKGSHIAVKMSDIVTDLLSKGLSKKEVARDIGISEKEVDIFTKKNIFEIKNVKDHKYSKAWIPKKILPKNKA